MIFVDTSFFFALASKKDHERALTYFAMEVIWLWPRIVGHNQDVS